MLVVEDGPTVTHGGMAYGAGALAARNFGAAEMVDPRPFVNGSLADALANNPHLSHVLPALGYSPAQCQEMTHAINTSPAEIVIDASPAKLEDVVDVRVPIVSVRYRFQQISGEPILDSIQRYLQSSRP